MKNNQVAYLTACVPTTDRRSIESLKYKTDNFEEVFKFKKICKELGCDYLVRFKDVEKVEKDYVVRTAPKEGGLFSRTSLYNLVSNLFNK